MRESTGSEPDRGPSGQGEQALLGKIFELNPYGIMIADAQGRAVRWNEAATHLFSEGTAPPASYSLFEDPLLLRAGLKNQLEQLRRGEPIAPIEVWYDAHELIPSLPSKPVYVRTTAFAIKDEDRVSHVVLMHQDITAQKQAERMLRRREALLQAIAGSAQAFLESRRWQDCMEQVLREVGQAVEVSRAYLFECTEAQRIRLNCLWACEGHAPAWPQDCEEHAVDAAPFNRWNQLLRNQQTIEGPADRFPESERAALEARSIQSVLQIPVFVDGRWFGAIGFDDCIQARQWSDGEVAALRTLAGLLGGTIQRQRAEEALQRTNDLLEARVDERTAELLSVNEELQSQIEQRRASEDRMRAFVTHMPVMVVALDDERRVVAWNGEAERVSGYSAEEVLGKKAFEVLYPDKRYREHIISECETRRYGVDNLHCEVTCKDGTTRVVSWSSRADKIAIPGWSAWATGVDVSKAVLTEQQLARSEARLRATVDALPDLMFVLDEDGRYVDVLSREQDLQLAPGRDRRGLVLQDIMPERTAGELRKVIREAIRTGDIQDCEYLLEGPTGQLWYEARSAPIVSTEEGKRTVVWAARDITDRKRAAAALEESEAKYRTLIENLNVGVNRITVSPESRCIHANQACAEIFGYDSLDEFLALPLEQRYADPADRGKLISRVIRHGSFRNYEVRIRRKDGTQAIVSCTAKAHYGENGRVDYFDGIIEDVTERKQVEERLSLLSKVAEQTTEGIAVAGIDRRVLFANSAWAAMHGMQAADIIGQPVSVFHTPDQVEEAVDQVAKKVRRTGRFRGIVWHVRKDGTPFPTLMTVSAMRGPRRELMGFIGTAVDMTEQLEAEAQRRLLARAVENAGEGIGIINRDGTLTYANAALAQILGRRKRSGILEHQWTEFFKPGNFEKVADIKNALNRTSRWAGRLIGSGLDGRTVPVAVTLVRMGQGEGEGLVVANIRDQSAEEAHLAHIRKLTLAAAQGLEDERARLSRELHDELGQTLTAIHLNLAWLSSRSEQWGQPAQERLAEAKQFVNDMLESVRSLSTSLRPPILDNRGLLDAIRSYAGDFARRAGIACRVVAVPSDMEVPDPVATTAFRICQEAMTNIARHSRATKCGIFLKLVGPLLELKVRDNGVGAVPTRLEGVESLGIAGMRERAARVRGTLGIENRPEGGVCVTARLPWQQEQKRNEE